MQFLSESDIIERYFIQKKQHSNQIVRGIGDDAAVLSIPAGYEWVTTVDTLNENVHFFSNADPFDVGYKSLAVSISDLAAMSAQPHSALLSLSLPHVNPDWLTDFCAGFFNVAQQFNVDLIGGDLTRGPLSVTTVAHGTVPIGRALYRSGAQPGDFIYVSGTVGDAGLALRLLQQRTTDIIEDALLSRLLRPTPRVALGLALQGLATSAMDISDGLLIDLMKLCKASHVGARVEAALLPLSSVLQLKMKNRPDAWELALTAGDDYELLFTIPPSHRDKIRHLEGVTCVGRIVAGGDVNVYDTDDRLLQFNRPGYEHFS